MSVATRVAVHPAGAPSTKSHSDAPTLKQNWKQDARANTGLLPAKPTQVRPPVLPVTRGKVESIAIGGHRGSGENILQADCLPSVRENTIASFKQAVLGGAKFIEFDVQVTCDGVPVIWHDDWILTADESGTITRQLVRNTTLQQFKDLVHSLSKHLVRNFKTRTGDFSTTAKSWLATHEDELPTLAEVFTAIPEDIGFDIEIKTTTPSTWLATPPAEVQRLVEAIDSTVQQASQGSRRPIAFSSFDPDVCKSLRAKQTRIPVLFLSDAGECFHCDPRRTSIEAAIAVALQSNLQGLVFESAALRHHPEAPQLALSKGLSVLTFGLSNNDPQWVREQQALGVQAAIVDNVSIVTAGIMADADSQAARLSVAA